MRSSSAADSPLLAAAHPAPTVASTATVLMFGVASPVRRRRVRTPRVADLRGMDGERRGGGLWGVSLGQICSFANYSALGVLGHFGLVVCVRGPLTWARAA